MRTADDAALHAFVEGRRTALFRSAYLLCGDRHEAEDLVQSTLRLGGGPAESVGNSGRAKQLAKLLPKGVGPVEQVSLAVIIKHTTAAQAEEHPVGPLDGQYSVRRDGGVGYLVVDVRTGKQVRQKSGGVDPAANLCEPTNGEPRPAQCVREVLPDGRILTIWSDPMNYGGTPLWGPSSPPGSL